MGLIFIILLLLVFSIVFFSVWLWFYKGDDFSIELSYFAGKSAFKSGNLKKAKEKLLKVKETKSSPDVIKKLGIVHLNLKEFDEAKACFEQILKASPNDIDALTSLTQILQVQGRDEEALEIYNKLLSIDAKNVSYHINIANIYLKKGDNEKALETLLSAKEIAPDDKNVAFAITKLKSESCNVDDETGFNNLLDEYKQLSGEKNLPKDYDISIANLYAKNGEIDKAFNHCKKALEFNSEDVQASRLMGLIQLIKKDFAGAKNSLTAALNLQPSSKETHEIFSYLICNQDSGCERKKCRETYSKLVQRHIK